VESAEQGLLSRFGLGFYTSRTSLNSLSIKNRVLQIRQQPADRGSHRMGTFYGAGINFTALGALSGHGIVEAKLNAN
jgi:hypothetical protein